MTTMKTILGNHSKQKIAGILTALGLAIGAVGGVVANADINDTTNTVDVAVMLAAAAVPAFMVGMGGKWKEQSGEVADLIGDLQGQLDTHNAIQHVDDWTEIQKESQGD